MSPLSPLGSTNCARIRTLKSPPFLPFIIQTMSSHKNGASFSPNALFAAPLPKADSALFNPRIISYPINALYFIAGLIALVSLYHFLYIFYKFITRKRVYAWKQRTALSLFKFPAAVFDSFRTLAFRWTVPVGWSHELNVAEVGLTLGYMAVLLSWTFVNSTTTTRIKAEPHYYSDRAGRIAASQLPIMAALGMRNNVISWLTGVNFVKLNYLHRASARVLCILIWIHAGGRIHIRLLTDDAIVNGWVQAGVLAATSLTLLCLLAIRPIRERNYEAFLVVHFIFAFIFVLATLFHVRGRDLPNYGVWPAMVIWGFDRFIRLITLAIINFEYINPWSSQNSKKQLDAAVEVLSPSYIRVTIHRAKYLHWRPGQTAYLSFPSISTLPFESHPFTISSINNYSTSDDSVLVFFLRVRNGFTQKLLKEVSSDQTYKVFLNGPYGSPPILVGYQTVILIAGGSGVAFTLPFFLDILRRAKTGKNSCQKILFIWAIRDSDQIHWISDTLAAALDNVPPTISVDVQLYMTATTTDTPRKSDDDYKENDLATRASHSPSSRSQPSILQSSFVEFHQGRPDLKSLISKEVDEATGKISINVCGSHSLANAARKAIRSPRPMDILHGGPTTTLHVEAFSGF